jgi:TM2 domain-containing membrane protein YozV
LRSELHTWQIPERLARSGAACAPSTAASSGRSSLGVTAIWVIGWKLGSANRRSFEIAGRSACYLVGRYGPGEVGRVDVQSIEPGAVADPFGRCSPKSYAHAVVLSGVLGFVGLQHFYLGRIGEGLVDVGLTIAWIYCFASGLAAWGALFLVCDFAHSLTVTFLLLTGKFRDSQGRIVAYPGQNLAGIHTKNQDMRRPQ